jgi:hypothetical protein
MGGVMKMSDLNRAGSLRADFWQATAELRILNDQLPPDDLCGAITLQSAYSGIPLRVEYTSKHAGRCATVRIDDPDIVAAIKGIAAGVLKDRIDALRQQLADIGLDPDA